jgi:N4-(beta-N-acetylglucosaminyl)-L-asparaginase
MSKKMNRRDFVLTGVAAGLTLPGHRTIFGQAPVMLTQKSVKPIVISSENGNLYKNGGNVTCVQKAFDMIAKGADVLDALITGVNILELDPEEVSVGYGGVPNADGVVQLDSSCMHGPKKRAGAVASLEGVRTPSLVAKAVLENTDHHLLVGTGAQTFARNMGFRIESDLNTERSRSMWLEWKRRTDPSHYLNPKTRAESWRREVLRLVAQGSLTPSHVYGTINCNGINGKGEICGVTTTSGLFFKIPGRVGDSPILGAGLYVDNNVGAAGSTGRGEANLYNLCSFLIVEEMRRGAHPKDAGMEALKRITANTVEKRLLTSGGKPNFGINFYIIDAKGQYAGVSMYAEEVYAGSAYKSQYAICTEQGPQTLRCEPLFNERLIAN